MRPRLDLGPQIGGNVLYVLGVLPLGEDERGPMCLCLCQSGVPLHLEWGHVCFLQISFYSEGTCLSYRTFPQYVFRSDVT